MRKIPDEQKEEIEKERREKREKKRQEDKQASTRVHEGYHICYRY